MKAFALLLAAVVPLAAQTKKTVMVITDAEGVAGICRQNQTDSTDPELRRLLTAEANAAAEGFFAGGADEVIIWDGHDGSQTLSVDTIHPRSRLLIGSVGPTMLMERGMAALAFVGQHAHAGQRPAGMAHSFSSLGIQHLRCNGQPVGEIETHAAMAGSFNTPVIFLSGDQAAAADLLKIVPNAETAVVKESTAYYGCLSLSGPAARDLIRGKAERAMRRIGEIKPYRVEGPVTIEVEFSTRSTVGVLAPKGAEVVDARTLRFRGKDFREAWTAYSTR